MTVPDLSTLYPLNFEPLHSNDGRFTAEEWELTTAEERVDHQAFESVLLLDRWRLGTVSRDDESFDVLEILGSFERAGDVAIAAELLGTATADWGGSSGYGWDPDLVQGSASPEDVVDTAFVAIVRIPLRRALGSVSSARSLPSALRERAEAVTYTPAPPDAEYEVSVTFTAEPGLDRAGALRALRDEIDMSRSEFLEYCVGSIRSGGKELA